MWLLTIIVAVIVGLISGFVGFVAGAYVVAGKVIQVIDRYFQNQQGFLASAFSKQEADLRQKVAIEDARLKLEWDQVLTVTRNAPQA